MRLPNKLEKRNAADTLADDRSEYFTDDEANLPANQGFMAMAWRLQIGGITLAHDHSALRLRSTAAVPSPVPAIVCACRRGGFFMSPGVADAGARQLPSLGSTPRRDNSEDGVNESRRHDACFENDDTRLDKLRCE